jgi:hypothetical protein
MASAAAAKRVSATVLMLGVAAEPFVRRIDKLKKCLADECGACNGCP